MISEKFWDDEILSSPMHQSFSWLSKDRAKIRCNERNLPIEQYEKMWRMDIDRIWIMEVAGTSLMAIVDLKSGKKDRITPYQTQIYKYALKTRFAHYIAILRPQNPKAWNGRCPPDDELLDFGLWDPLNNERHLATMTVLEFIDWELDGRDFGDIPHAKWKAYPPKFYC